MLRYAVTAAALFMAVPALAQDQPAEGPVDESQDISGSDSGLDLSGSLSLLSDYRFRGVSRSDEDPAAQAQLTLSHGSGLYAGVTATTLKGVDSYRARDLGDVEFDLYAGYGAQLGGGFSADAGLLYYVFAGGDGPTDYVEPYASLSYLIGPVDLTAGAKYAPSQNAIGDQDMLYLFAQADVSIPFSPWRFSALVGRQDWGRDYWSWSLGTEYRFGLGGGTDVLFGLRYVDTSLGSAPGGDSTLVASARLRF